ncbi:MAG TPA: RsfA family transcriptional regulator [Bacillales bacterium]|nr:RsfA family transcriptional regulator [Bacillales bacterium]
MAASRQDAWNHEEDLILAEVVLRHIREGSTQLAAFEEVGERLSRTAAACGFRWNSLVRKQYKSAIALAKKQRKQMKQKPHPAEGKTENEKSEALSLDGVIAYLEKLRSTRDNHEKLIHENEKLQSQILRLKEENAELANKVDEIKKENHSIREDYQALMAIMDRARKRAVMEEEDVEAKLEKVDK